MLMQKYCNFDKYPEKKIEGFEALQGWEAIRERIRSSHCQRTVITAEFYPGVNRSELVSELEKLGGSMYDAEQCTISNGSFHARIEEFLTDDRVFGIMNTLNLDCAYDSSLIVKMRASIAADRENLIIVYGTGASLITEGNLLLYFDMPRWEIQCRFRRGMPNWKTENSHEDRLKKFKQGFFVEWRMADRHKKKLLDKIDFIVDTVLPDEPKMVSGDGFRKGLRTFSEEPFRLVPYYAPEVWGGQWMKEVCGLDPDKENFAWAFDGVPEENSIFMRFENVRMEFPSVDVVFYQPEELLGGCVHARFGDEFPIRFDFLDTMGGQNLSLQVHPLTEYIQNTFGMHYTQDESYYILDCVEDAVVYLGLKDGISGEDMLRDLAAAQTGEAAFEAERYVNVWKTKKHDHFLIPAGTIHCSGRNTMVLEISATPYIFTFKLWDWERLGLDGKPRPVHLEHGANVIQWDRTTEWVRENLINQFHAVDQEDGYMEERTGLHEREFIETRRYKLAGSRAFDCGGGVSMCNVVDGEGVVITSPDRLFQPFVAHYAETFIIPASVGKFELAPLNRTCTVIRATVR